jgi:penicillin-binding protein 2
MKLMPTWLRRKMFGARIDRTLSEIAPEEVMLDSSNLPHFNAGQMEGRVEMPLSKGTVFVTGLIFFLAVATFNYRMFSLSIVHGAEYAQRAIENSTGYRVTFAERGIVYDRKGVELAWNEASTTLPFAARRYTDLSGMGHVLGYVKYPKADARGAWWRTEYKGIAGIEETFNEELAGENGREIVEVTAKGVSKGDRLVVPPQDGTNITLSIDSELQHKLFETLSAHAIKNGFQGGAAAIMDVRTGQLIALTSFPEYSPEALVSGNSALISSYASSTKKAYLNRAIAGLFTPGSIVKPLFAAAALQEKTITPDKKFYSDGTFEIPNPNKGGKTTVIRDWKAHGWVDMRRAIAVSSNVYFWSIGGGTAGQVGLGITRLEKYARAFGLGEKTGIALAGEEKGLIPNPTWKAKMFEEGDWLLGDTYNTAIGQYGFQLTPLQAVRYTAAIANGGTLFTPSLRASTTAVSVTVGIEDEYLQVVREGMRQGALPGGTSQSLAMPGIHIAGKTGTAELGTKKQWMNSLAIGFWPYEKPRYAYAVALERAPKGTLSGAAPGMRPFFEWLIQKHPEYVRFVASASTTDSLHAPDTSSDIQDIDL